MSVEYFKNALSLLLSNDITGAVTWIGTIAGLVGLLFTYRQSRQAKEAADTAVREIKKYQRQAVVLNVGRVSSNLESLERSVIDSNFNAAAIHIEYVSRDIIEIIAADSSDGLHIVRRNIRIIRNKVNGGIVEGKNFDLQSVRKAIGGLRSYVDDRVIHYRSKTGDEV
ncbi:MAG: hypothetical protein O9342_17200 [Beijerinckiaceae bacterium]|nr:hypothetical protein [Beijerinckiaceae bacterium]